MYSSGLIVRVLGRHLDRFGSGWTMVSCEVLPFIRSVLQDYQQEREEQQQQATDQPYNRFHHDLLQLLFDLIEDVRINRAHLYSHLLRQIYQL